MTDHYTRERTIRLAAYQAAHAPIVPAWLDLIVGVAVSALLGASLLWWAL